MNLIEALKRFIPMRRQLSGIFYGWWIVAASFVMFLICGGIAYYGFTSFFNPIADEFKWSAATVSLAFSLRNVEAGALAPFIGFFMDKLGVRKVIVFGIAVSGLSLLMMSRTNSLFFFYISFLLLSTGASCAVGMGQYVAIANWFSRKRSWAFGLTSAGYAFSGIVGPVLVWLIAQYGWRSSLIVAGLATLAVGIPLGLLIRHRPEPYGYVADGKRQQTPSVESSAGESVSTSTLSADRLQTTGLTTRQALATSTFWWLTVFGLLTGLAQSAIMVHEMPYLTSVGISREIAGWGLLGITGCSLAGRLGFGRLGDRYDKRLLLAAGAVLQFIGVMILAWVSTPWMIIPFVLFYGPGYASQIPLWPALRADYFGLKHYAAIGGLLGLGWTACGLIAPLLAGWAFDISGSYRLIWLAYAIATAAGIPFVLLIKARNRLSGASDLSSAR